MVRCRLPWAALLPVVWLLARSSTKVDHQAFPRAHTPEHFRFSTIVGAYPSGLSAGQRALVHRYRPVEAVARKVQAWSEETGLWGGRQALRIELRSVRLPARWQWDDAGPLVIGSAVGYRGEDHLDLGVEILQQQVLLHRMEIKRTFPATNRSVAQVFCSERAMDDLSSDVAWQIVFELTPPGYDEPIIRAGHRDGVAAATMVAEKRGLLNVGELLGAAATGRSREAGVTDKYRASVLAGPSWMPDWLWADPVSLKKCRERAAEDARRR